MRKFLFPLLLTASSCCLAFAQQENRRVIVTTDIGGTDPDDEESMVHLLMMANDIDIEGMVCQMAFCNSPIGIATLNKIIDAYALAETNLKAHDPRFPTADYLRSIATTGQTEVGMSGVGKGKDTPGSELIIAAVDSDDPRPVWLTAWGGMNTIAQAIWKVKHTRSEKEFKKFLGKIRIYDILGQCDAGAWIAHNFPEILYIRARDVYNWAPDDNWTKENVQAFPPMGNVYPPRRWATEGDSPSFLYLVNNGLNIPEDVTAGGWGGRFSKKRTEAVRGMDWVERNNLDEKQYDPYFMHTNPDGEQTIQRWSDAIRNDFAAIMQWSSKADFSAANHHPVILLNKESKPTRKPMSIKAKAGETIRFSIKNSYDPDGNSLRFSAYLYKEASEYNDNIDIRNSNGSFSFTVPKDANGKVLHIIIEAVDNGKPAITAYRRLVVKVAE